jgi:hypothetical protein
LLKIQQTVVALRHSVEDAVARDDMRDERAAAAIVEGPETVIQPANEPKGSLDAFHKRLKILTRSSLGETRVRSSC